MVRSVEHSVEHSVEGSVEHCWETVPVGLAPQVRLQDHEYAEVEGDCRCFGEVHFEDRFWEVVQVELAPRLLYPDLERGVAEGACHHFGEGYFAVGRCWEVVLVELVHRVLLRCLEHGVVVLRDDRRFADHFAGHFVEVEALGELVRRL